MVLPAELLWTQIADKVTRSCMNHQMPLHVFFGEKSLFTHFTVELLVLCTLNSPGSGVRLQVVDDVVARLECDAAQGAHQVAVLGLVHGHVLLEAGAGRVLLATGGAGTAEHQLVRVVRLHVVLEVVLAVEALVALSTLELPLLTVGQHMTHQLEFRREALVTSVADERPLACVRVLVLGEFSRAGEAFAAGGAAVGAFSSGRRGGAALRRLRRSRHGQQLTSVGGGSGSRGGAGGDGGRRRRSSGAPAISCSCNTDTQTPTD